MPLKDPEKYREYMRNYMQKRKLKDRDEIDKSLEKRADIQKEKKEQEFNQPLFRRPVSIFNDNWGSNLFSDSQTPQTRIDNPRSDLLGANAWGSTEEKPKVRTNQDRFKEIFGDRAE